MQPELETFREVVERYRGNLTMVAKAFGVSRKTICNWYNTGGDEWKHVIQDARMRLFDDCLISAEVLARGIPEKDEQGNIIGWIEKPDGQMVRYLLSTLGKNEGFGDTPETATDKPLDNQQKEVRIRVVYNDVKDLELQVDNGEKVNAE